MPILLEMDNSGAEDIGSSWSVGSCTHHVDVPNYFLHKPKDQGTVIIKHISGDTNHADILMKNMTSVVFNCRVPLYVGHDEYIRVLKQTLSGEAV